MQRGGGEGRSRFTAAPAGGHALRTSARCLQQRRPDGSRRVDSGGTKTPGTGLIPARPAPRCCRRSSDVTGAHFFAVDPGPAHLSQRGVHLHPQEIPMTHPREVVDRARALRAAGYSVAAKRNAAFFPRAKGSPQACPYRQRRSSHGLCGRDVSAGHTSQSRFLRPVAYVRVAPAVHDIGYRVDQVFRTKSFFGLAR